MQSDAQTRCASCWLKDRKLKSWKTCSRREMFTPAHIPNHYPRPHLFSFASELCSHCELAHQAHQPASQSAQTSLPPSHSATTTFCCRTQCSRKATNCRSPPSPPGSANVFTLSFSYARSYYELAHSVQEEVINQPMYLRPPNGASLREYQVCESYRR